MGAQRETDACCSGRKRRLDKRIWGGASGYGQEPITTPDAHIYIRYAKMAPEEAEEKNMNRIKIEDALLAMGVPAGIKGFNYIVDAIEIFDKIGTNISITKELYPAVAEKNRTTPSRAERAIRHAFEIARPRGSVETTSKYIGTVNCNNSSSLKQFYMILKREES